MTQGNFFLWVFVAPYASRLAYPHCMQLVGLDGTFLKGKYLEILLIVVTIDANDQLLILAYPRCMQLIGLDGTFLIGKYLGILLIVVTLDANGQLLILAYAIVKGEDSETWTWFCRMFNEAFPTINSGESVVISD